MDIDFVVLPYRFVRSRTGVWNLELDDDTPRCSSCHSTRELIIVGDVEPVVLCEECLVPVTIWGFAERYYDFDSGN